MDSPFATRPDSHDRDLKAPPSTIFHQHELTVDLTTADIPTEAARLGFVMPAGASTATWDQDGKARLLAAVAAAGGVI